MYLRFFLLFAFVSHPYVCLLCVIGGLYLSSDLAVFVARWWWLILCLVSLLQDVARGVAFQKEVPVNLLAYYGGPTKLNEVLVMMLVLPYLKASVICVLHYLAGAPPNLLLFR